MTDKTLGAYQRTTPDPDETTGEALARLQAEMTRLLDEADAELRDAAEGGVTAALIEQEAEKRDPSVDYHAMWWMAEREREQAERERDEARATKDMHKRRADEERARAEKAEAALADLRDLYGTVVREKDEWEANAEAAEERLRVTDAMVARARESLRSDGWTVGEDDTGLRAALTAALTEPPARPEGAERFDPIVDSAIRGHSDITSPDVVRAVSDALAEEGVRAPEGSGR